ncbi:hypothetical protein J1N35_032304 [Gossypium stocksii]|uniref:Gag1-like clamp domain-containing protein n=1 Tax=Gossypium stocksii TaxID=47602 RepID=A0A9D3V461_9ROSI|nr:hypothetical protein J1N35_032304 [Gossypium stocksii]
MSSRLRKMIDMSMSLCFMCNHSLIIFNITHFEASLFFSIILRFLYYYGCKFDGFFFQLRRGCFGCFIAVDDPSKRLKIKGRKAKRSSCSEDFWNSSGCEMEHSGVQSQGSISSTNASNLDPSGSRSHPSEFVNHGLLLWNQTRQQWLGNNKSEKQVQPRQPTISWNTIYESLNGNYKPFPHPIPLPEMVDFLVGVWEQEGLYG